MAHATNAGENRKKTTQHDFLGIKPGKFSEKLVAAIHRTEMQGAEVKWNDEIDGRQFDVTVRFTRGPYNYLTVIECKDWDRPVPVEKIEALVTKAGDVKADKAVMVSASGFQSGCFTVAEKHGIELFTVEEIEAVSDDLLVEGLIPFLSCYNFRLQVAGRRKPLVLPEARNILPFLVRKAVIKNGPVQISLEALVNELVKQLFRGATFKEERYRHTVRPETKISLPNIVSGNTLETITFKLSAFEFRYRLIHARKLRLAANLDPYVFTLMHRSYRFTNVTTKSSKDYKASKLDVGRDTVIQGGKFYIDTDTDFYYYCKKVEGDQIFMTLIEAYQHGDDVRWDLVYQGATVDNYIEVTDSKEMARLNAMLKSFRRAASSSSISSQTKQ